MGWLNYIKEANKGDGFALSPKLFFYFRYILTLIIAVILVIGYKVVIDRW